MQRILGPMVIVLLYLSALGVSPVSAVHSAEAKSVAPGVDGKPTPSQRLKYRRGPVCMCGVNGISEQDIKAAERRRLEESMRVAPASDDAQDRHD
ncbi:MAG: hypothetical protein DWQ09_16065 [Proteobacteria bacterium]|nr:MAG: hypothetical protein DWQ09_16065 [Pseudomonadota bacterium]